MNFPNGYSADVRLQLIIGQRAFEVEQVLRDVCLLAEPIDHPPCEGEFVMHVDGRRRCWPVSLPNGISRHCAETKLT